MDYCTLSNQMSTSSPRNLASVEMDIARGKLDLFLETYRCEYKRENWVTITQILYGTLYGVVAKFFSGKICVWAEIKLPSSRGPD